MLHLPQTLEVYKLIRLPRGVGFAKSIAGEELCRCYGGMENAHNYSC